MKNLKGEGNVIFELIYNGKNLSDFDLNDYIPLVRESVEVGIFDLFELLEEEGLLVFDEEDGVFYYKDKELLKEKWLDYSEDISNEILDRIRKWNTESISAEDWKLLRSKLLDFINLLNNKALSNKVFVPIED